MTVEAKKRQGRFKARWTRLAVVGLLIQGTTAFILQVGSLFFHWWYFGRQWVLVGINVVLLSATAVALVGALIVYQFGGCAKLTGFFAPVISMGIPLWYAVGPYLSFPQSVSDLVPALLLIPGGVIAMAGSIAAWSSDRAGLRTPSAQAGELSSIQFVIGALILVVLMLGARAALLEPTMPNLVFDVLRNLSPLESA